MNISKILETIFIKSNTNQSIPKPSWGVNPLKMDDMNRWTGKSKVPKVKKQSPQHQGKCCTWVPEPNATFPLQCLLISVKKQFPFLLPVLPSSQEWRQLWVGAACPAASWVDPTATAGCGRRERRAASSSPRSGSASGSCSRGLPCTGTPANRWA